VGPTVDATTQQKKAELRKRLRRVLTGLTAVEWAQGSEGVCKRLLESISLATRNKQHGAVLFFMPTAKEVDIGPAAADCLARGIDVCLPRADWETGVITPALVSNWGREELVETKHGIFEPRPDAKPVDLARLDLVIVPGLAFDASGGRLGKGGGFYDRFLGQPGLRAAKVGVGLDQQVVEQIPRDAWDVALDALVTPTRTMVFGPPAGR
jgi:5-formyltetrahydrofolate cyclo-ligase